MTRPSSSLCFALVATVATAVDHPSLHWAVSALEPHLSAAQVKAHHDADGVYVDRLNRELSGAGPIALESVDNLARNCGRSLLCPDVVTRLANAVVNNNFAWSSVDANGGDQNKPAGRFMAEIKRDFGGFDEFKEKFIKAADEFFGAGFVTLVRRGDTHLLDLIATQDAQSVVRQSHEPLLSINLWDRAYIIDFGANKAAYAKSFLNVADWIRATGRHYQAQVLHGDIKQDL